MGKDIFKEVPKGFHNQFMDTIERIANGEADHKKRKVSFKKMVLLVAATVAVLSTMTAGATTLYKMHQTAAERLGVDEQLADQLVRTGVVQEEQVLVRGEGLTIEALQSVYREDSIYLLVSVEVPEGISLDRDSLFESIEVVSEQTFTAAVINSIADSIQGDASLWEVVLQLEEGQQYAGQNVTVQLNNLIQTYKTETIGTLAEGEWKISFRIPQEAEGAVYRCEREVVMGSHALQLDRLEANPFGLQLYLEEEAVQHALQYQNIRVTAVRYNDGREVEEDLSISHRQIQTNKETGERYVHLSLQNAVDTTKLAAIILNGGEREILLGQELMVGENQVDEQLWETANSTVPENFEALELLYVKNGHAILQDTTAVYLWDVDCGHMEVLMDLEALGYDESQGGQLAVGPGGNMVFVSPTADSVQIYVGNVAYGLDRLTNAYDLLRESGWPAQDWNNAGGYELRVENGTLHLY